MTLQSSSNSNISSPKTILGLLVQDHPGVMMKITAMFARRGYNISSISVGRSERPGFSRITLVAEASESIAQQMIKQLRKLIDVVKVTLLVESNTSVREFALVKVGIKDNSQRQEVITMINLYNAKAVEVTTKAMTIEVVGGIRKIDSFLEVISDIAPVRELVRSGIIAISRGDESINLD
jgi:acetolactate synthase-1/3 small subunit